MQNRFGHQQFVHSVTQDAPERRNLELSRAALRAPSHACYDVGVARDLTQRQLRNESGEIMRALDSGESFVVTRNGVPVGELKPLQRRRFVARDAALDAFARAAPLDAHRFRADLDRSVDQDPTPRA